MVVAQETAFSWLASKSHSALAWRTVFPSFRPCQQYLAHYQARARSAPAR